MFGFLARAAFEGFLKSPPPNGRLLIGPWARVGHPDVVVAETSEKYKKPHSVPQLGDYMTTDSMAKKAELARIGEAFAKARASLSDEDRRENTLSSPARKKRSSAKMTS
jgi:hypothetical protein